MSTRSTIVVAISKNKWGKTYQFPKGDLEFDTPAITIPEGCKYVSVYHHWDGYLEGLGKKLINSEFKSFDEVMANIIAGGDMSVIGQPYHAWRNEEWDKYIQPKFSAELPERSEEYQYLRTQRGTWKYRGWETKDNFESVSKALDMQETKEYTTV